MKWSPKDPDEIRNFSIDWSRLIYPETISSVRWFLYDEDGVKTELTTPQTVNELTALQQSATSTVSTIQFSGGTAGVTYRVTCEITYNNITAERTVRLPIREA